MSMAMKLKASCLSAPVLSQNLAMTADRWQAPVQVQGRMLLFKFDTGAQVNVLPLHLYQKLKQKSPLKPTQTILTAFSNTKIQPAGTAQLECCIQSQAEAEFPCDGGRKRADLRPASM